MAQTRFRPVRTSPWRQATSDQQPSAPGRRGRVSPFLLTLFLMVLIPVFTYWWLDYKVRPVMVMTAKALAMRSATDALSQATTQEIAQLADYGRMVEIEDGPDGRTQVARFNFASVTQLQFAATKRAQAALRNLTLETLKIPSGQVLAGPLAAGVGPGIPVRMYVIGTAHSSIATEVKSVGVNQTVHILYLDLSAQVNVVAPLVATPITVQSRIPIAYVVLAGPVPNTYLNGQTTPSIVLPGIAVPSQSKPAN